MRKEGKTESKRSLEGIFLALFFCLFAVGGVVLGFKRWLPPLASEHGAGIDRMIQYLMITVGSLFVLGHAVLGYFIWRFSTSDARAYPLPSPKAERNWSLVPVIVLALVAEGGVLVLGLPIWSKFYAQSAPGNAINVEVTGEQFAWNIRYPGKDGVFGRSNSRLITLSNPLGLDEKDRSARDDVVILGVMQLPVNRPARLRLRSKDVLHSFNLPHFRVKQDAVPGMTIDVWFVPTQVGTYEIACTELCGFGHYMMRGVLQIVPPEEFEKWIREEPTFF